MKKVFISYAHEDINMAEQLYFQLKSIYEIAPWFDKENLLPGMKWEETIKKAIRESDFFIILVSNNSIKKRGFVQKEITEAFEELKKCPENQIFLIPIRLEQVEINQFPLELQKIQYVDFFPDWNEGITKVIKAINPQYKSYLPEWIIGRWYGSWNRHEQLREAEMMVYGDKQNESFMKIKYHKSGRLSIVEQQIDLVVNGNDITISGKGSKFIEQGNAKNWFLDTFKLKLSNDKTQLFGIKFDKRPEKSEVNFYRDRNRII